MNGDKMQRMNAINECGEISPKENLYSRGVRDKKVMCMQKSFQDKTCPQKLPKGRIKCKARMREEEKYAEKSIYERKYPRKMPQNRKKVCNKSIT